MLRLEGYRECKIRESRRWRSRGFASSGTMTINHIWIIDCRRDCYWYREWRVFSDACVTQWVPLFITHPQTHSPTKCSNKLPGGLGKEEKRSEEPLNYLRIRGKPKGLDPWVYSLNCERHWNSGTISDLSKKSSYVVGATHLLDYEQFVAVFTVKVSLYLPPAGQRKEIVFLVTNFKNKRRPLH